MTTLDRAFIKAFGDAPSAAMRTVYSDSPTPAPRILGKQTMLSGEYATQAAVQASLTSPRTPTPEEPNLSALKPPGRPHMLSAPQSTFTAAPKSAEPLRALLEVDHLAWPDACETLLRRAHNGWDALAAQLIEQSRQDKNCMAISSCRRAEGRTSVALAIARHLGALGIRCVIVDADMEMPNLARNCGISTQTGWDDVLHAKMPLGEALITATADNVTLMPSRAPAARGEFLHGARHTATGFTQLRSSFDLVLFDTAPLVDAAAVADFASFAEAVHLDALYMIRDVRLSTADELAATVATLQKSGVNVAGVIENFVADSLPSQSARKETSPQGAGQELAA